MGISTNLNEIIGGLKVAQGEVEYVHDAVLRDLSNAALDTVMAGWPVAAENGGTSLAGWQLEHPETGHWVILNPVDYTSWVWSNRKHKGPPVQDLWLKLIVGALADIEEDWERFVSDRVLDLLEAA